MQRKSHWSVALGIAALATLTATPAALAQNYPTRPVRVITLTAPGGSLDILARTLAQSLSEAPWASSSMWRTRSAPAATSASPSSRASPADGYTIGMITVSTHGINPSLFGSKLPFDALNDFEFLAIAAELKNVVVVNPKVPANNMQELVRYAKDNPGKISFGSAGIGTSQHMAGELFKQLAGIDISHVAYRGAAQAAPDLVAGRNPAHVLQHSRRAGLHPVGQAARHRHLDQDPLAGAARRGAGRRAGISRLRREGLVRPRRAEGHAAGNRRLRSTGRSTPHSPSPT